MSDIDAAKVMHWHRESEWPGRCETCLDSDGGMVEWPCEPYELAEALAAEQARVARVVAFAAEWRQFGGAEAAECASDVDFALDKSERA